MDRPYGVILCFGVLCPARTMRMMMSSSIGQLLRHYSPDLEVFRVLGATSGSTIGCMVGGGELADLVDMARWVPQRRTPCGFVTSTIPRSTRELRLGGEFCALYFIPCLTDLSLCDGRGCSLPTSFCGRLTCGIVYRSSSFFLDWISPIGMDGCTQDKRCH